MESIDSIFADEWRNPFTNEPADIEPEPEIEICPLSGFKKCEECNNCEEEG